MAFIGSCSIYLQMRLDRRLQPLYAADLNCYNIHGLSTIETMQWVKHEVGLAAQSRMIKSRLPLASSYVVLSKASTESKVSSVPKVSLISKVPKRRDA